MRYRLSLFCIGLLFLLVMFALPENSIASILSAFVGGACHALVACDLVRPGTIRGLME